VLEDDEPVPPVALLPDVEPVPEVPEPDVLEPEVPDPEVPEPDVPDPEVPPLNEPDALALPLAPVPLVVSVEPDEAEDDDGVVVDGVTTVELDEDGDVAGVAPDEVVEEVLEAGRSQPVAKAAASARAAVRETIFIWSLHGWLLNPPAGGP
jgi:segregation and condensation protein B